MCSMKPWADSVNLFTAAVYMARVGVGCTLRLSSLLHIAAQVRKLQNPGTHSENAAMAVQKRIRATGTLLSRASGRRPEFSG
jgi:hypothetical protein